MTPSLDHAPRSSSITAVERIAQGLGVLSIGLGLAEILFPGTIARALGLNGRKGLLRAYGVREIAAGVGALQPNPAPAMWSRVAGDLIDMATLAQARSQEDGRERRAANAAMIAVGVITALDLAVAAATSAQVVRPGEGRDYSDRTGFPQGIEAARGAAAGYAPPDSRVSPRPAAAAESEMRPV